MARTIKKDIPLKEQGPQVCILKTDGINCDSELANAFATAGGKPPTLPL